MTQHQSFDPNELDALLSELVAELAAPAVEAIGLLGSHARGEGGRYSDVDLNLFLSHSPNDPRQRYRLLLRGGALVSLSAGTIDERRAALGRPERAIWDVPGLRQMRILLDRHGRLAMLQAEAVAFAWPPLQPAANAYASYQLMGYAEEVYKVVGALNRLDRSAIAYATFGLLRGMPDIVAVSHGLMIPSENQYLGLVQRAMGEHSAWTRAYRLAVGWEWTAGDPVLERGRAALQLYGETYRHVGANILPQDRTVIEAAQRAIGAAE